MLKRIAIIYVCIMCLALLACGAPEVEYFPSNTGLNIINDGETKPIVANYRALRTRNSQPTVITDFKGGVVGQDILVIFGDSHTVIQSNDNIILQFGLDFNGMPNDILKFIYDGMVWIEIDRTLH